MGSVAANTKLVAFDPFIRRHGVESWGQTATPPLDFINADQCSSALIAHGERISIPSFLNESIVPANEVLNDRLSRALRNVLVHVPGGY